MYETSFYPGLSKYQKFILNKIIAGFEENKEINIHDLVQGIVSQKCILPNQTELVTETVYMLKEYLLANEMAIEKEEMTAYLLTEKGCRLMASHTIEQFEKNESGKNKRSVMHQLFHGDKNKKKKSSPEDMMSCYE